VSYLLVTVQPENGEASRWVATRPVVSLVWSLFSSVVDIIIDAQKQQRRETGDRRRQWGGAEGGGRGRRIYFDTNSSDRAHYVVWPPADRGALATNRSTRWTVRVTRDGAVGVGRQPDQIRTHWRGWAILKEVVRCPRPRTTALPIPDPITHTHTQLYFVRNMTAKWIQN